LAVKQIKGEDDFAQSEGDADSSDEAPAQKKFIDSSNKFGVKALKSKTPDARDTGKVIDSEKVMRAARQVTGRTAEESDESDDQPTYKPVVQQEQPEKKSQKKVGFTTVEFGDGDLKNFNVEKGKLIKEKNMAEREDGKDADEAKLLKSLFVT
jgi:hypothetical protein